jgi:lysophospholipase L1-like esterase
MRTRFKVRRVFEIFLVAGWVLVTGILLTNGQWTQELRSKTGGGVSDIIESRTNNTQQTLRILFIGNSYTFFNDMPRMVAEIASSDPNNPFKLEIKSVTQGGGRLPEQLKTGEGHHAIQSGRWDFVVLQEQSFWAVHPSTVAETTNAAAQWTDLIREQNAKPVLYMTWPRKPGSFWYTDKDHAFLKNSNFMYSAFHRETNRLATKLKAGVVPVGDYWMYTLENHPGIDLYASDGSHPSPSGSYLAALLFYRYFTARSPEEASYTPWGLDKDAVKNLKTIAAMGEDF